MIKQEIEQKFHEMGLLYNRNSDYWYFPPGIDSPYQFAARAIPNSGSNKTMQVVIHGGPVVFQGWYMPDQGIQRIQMIIEEIFETYAEKRH